MADPATVCNSSGQVMKFIKKNGGTILLRSGHQFYARRKHSTGLTVWACTKRKTCKGLLRIKDEQILEATEHTHAPDDAKNEIAISINNLKSELTKPDFANIPQKYKALVGNLKDAGLDIISEIPKFIKALYTDIEIMKPEFRR